MRILPGCAVLLSLTTPTFADKVITQDDIVEMISKRDVAAIKAISRFPLELRDMWFPDPKCAALSMKWAQVDEGKLPLVVDCLADLGLRMDGSWAVYDPGVPVAVGVNDNVLRGFGSIMAIDAATPKIHARELLKHHGGKQEVEPDPATRAAVEKTPGAFLAVEAQICIAASGVVEKVTILDENEKFPAYGRTVEKAVRGWKVAPFTRGGKAMRVCTDVGIAPAGSLRKPLESWGPHPPPPLYPPSPTRSQQQPPTTQNVPPQVLEGVRIAGSKVITPDHETKLAIQAAKKERLVGSFKLCISDGGFPTTVSMLKSTGFPRYDAAIEAGMRTWRYRPYEVDGKPAAVCTAITFIYTQKD